MECARLRERRRFRKEVAAEDQSFSAWTYGNHVYMFLLLRLCPGELPGCGWPSHVPSSPHQPRGSGRQVTRPPPGPFSPPAFATPTATNWSGCSQLSGTLGRVFHLLRVLLPVFSLLSQERGQICSLVLPLFVYLQSQPRKRLSMPGERNYFKVRGVYC